MIAPTCTHYFLMTSSNLVAFAVSSKSALAIALQPHLLDLMLKSNFLDGFVQDDNHDATCYPPN